MAIPSLTGSKVQEAGQATPQSQKDPRASTAQTTSQYNLTGWHGGNFEPPTDRYDLAGWHGGDYEPSTSSKQPNSEHLPSEYRRDGQGPSDVPDDSSPLMTNNKTTNTNKESIPLGRMPRRKQPKTRFAHRDPLGRPFLGYRDQEQTLDPASRRLADLVVQCVDYRHRPLGDSWRRIGVENRSPAIIRLAEWTLARRRVGEKIQPDTAMAIVRWLPGCVALLFTMLIPANLAAAPRNFGRYDAFPYKDWAYPYEARNVFEKRKTTNPNPQQRLPSAPVEAEIRLPRESQAIPSRPMIERILEPPVLCFLTSDGAKRQKVSEWRESKGFEPEARVEYVVVSFTGLHFPGDANPSYLHEVGQHAARQVEVPAYWISTSCLGESKEEQSDNVWRICDIVRGAHSLVVAVSDPSQAGKQTETLLEEWAARVWTWPEILLSPGGGDMYIYDQDNPLEARFPWSRRNLLSLWNRARDLAGPSAQIIDHYEGSVILTHLELVSLALECLAKRHTAQFLPGDLSYALMGLLRQRPEVVRQDNDFQAFARLSLANDSNLLLERLICLLPKGSDEPWYSLRDEWDVALWEIYPKSQVCGIGDGETVIIAGIRGAAIRWKSFAPVLTLVRENLARKILRYMIRTAPGIFLAGLLFVILAAAIGIATSEASGYEASQVNVAFLIPGLIFLIPSAIILLFSPSILRSIYRGKVWDAQPWLFGVEGYMSLLDLELNIFGSYEGKLKWSAFGSPLSRHAPDEDEGFEHFYVGKDPSHDSDVAKRIEQAKSRDDSEQIFTLVDTGTMTVTLFSAARPPVAMLLCGEEGGMQRALLCSYDWRTSTLYRETVLRVETTVSDKMQYMSRVRLGLRR